MLDRSTLADWVGQVAWLLDPLVDAIGKHVFAGEKIHGDDTTERVLEPGLGRTRIGRLWVYVRDARPCAGTAPPAAMYFYSPDRGGKHPAAHLASFTGYLQADGYSGFGALYNPARDKPGPIIEVACWAHCRRHIFDDWEQTKSPVAMGLGSQSEVAGGSAVEITAAEDPRAILHGMRSMDLAPFCSHSQGAWRNTDDGSGLTKVEPRFNAVCRLTIDRNPTAGS